MIPLFSLKDELLTHNKQFTAAVSRVLKRGNFILGEELTHLEDELALATGARYCVGLSSGTSALTLACQALGIKPDDKVIVPTLSLPTAFGVADSGARFVLVDARAQDLQMDPKSVKQALKNHKNIKAIVVIHLYGLAAPINEIIHIANANRIPIIEDCAQAFGVQVDGKHVGTFGALGALSFYPTKNLGAFGDAGAMITNDKKLAEHIRMRRMYGESLRYHSEFAGTNSRLDELQAAILRVKLSHFKQTKKARQNLAALYSLHLKPLNLKLLSPTGDSEPVPHLFVIQTSRRDELQQFLAKHKIGTGIHYPLPIHLQPAFKKLGYKKGDFPVAERAAQTLLSLPFYPTLTTNDIEKVANAIKQFFKDR